jgi:hypothetical protein
MKEFDWDIHFITDSYGIGGTVNRHTHGMKKYKHLNFQVVLNLQPEEIGRLLNIMGTRVKNGEKFNAGDMVDGLYLNIAVRLDLYIEAKREVLRLIIPDENNLFPENTRCQSPYKYQTQRMFETL